MKKKLLLEFMQNKRLKPFSLFILVFMASINVSHGQYTNTWVGGTSTDFLDANNWTATLTATPFTPGTVTFATNTTFSIGSGTTYSPTLSVNYPAAGQVSNGITLKSGAMLTTNGTMLLGGSTSYTYIDGELTVTGGNFNVRTNLYIANTITAGTSAVVNIQTGGTLNVKNVATIGKSGRLGTVNVNGGTFSSENQATGGLTVGTTSSTGPGVLNINSGLVSINRLPSGLTINTYGTINIDAGSIVLAGNQTTAIATFISSNKIKVSGQALLDGKIISNTFDAATNKTTVIAISSPLITTTTWNGTSWSDGAPTATIEAVIEGAYSTTTNGSFNAKKLTVNSGSLTINSGTIITVQNEVVNNAGTNGIVIQNNGNLIQANNTTNTGNVVVNRNSNALNRLDYTIWSSPVVGQNLAAFSPLTSQTPSRFYNFNTTYNIAGVNGAFNVIANPTVTNFAAGSGYLIRMPNTDLTSGYDAGSATLTFPGQFIGVPNNGDITVPLLDGGAVGLRFNLVGNPYPSPINLYTFVTENTAKIQTTLYFWRKTNGVGTAYCTYIPTSPTAGTYVTNSNSLSVNPASILQIGQGFFVEAKTGQTSILFKNSQRWGNVAGQFFKTKQIAAGDKVWLNATNAAGDFSQMAVTYFDGATQGVDNFDGKYINDSPLALTSNINNDEYTIQGRPTFDASDVVPLNFKTAVAGDYTIAIDHSEGVFAAGQSVILTDATTGTETDLTTSSYTFTAATGSASSRFSLKYQKTLKVDASVANDNSVVVYKNNGVIYVNSGVSAIANIKVFDIQGRLIVEQKDVKSNTATINNLKDVHQVLVVQVTSEDNKVVNKKVVK
jgi:hypothetical protein